MAGNDFDNDIEGLAAEYVLGTLDAAERAEVESRLAGDKTLRQAVAVWEQRLEPLLDRVPEATPPAAIKDTVLKAIAQSDNQPGGDIPAGRGAAQSPTAQPPEHNARNIGRAADTTTNNAADKASIIDFQQRIKRWRTAAAATAAIAATLAGFIIYQDIYKPFVPGTSAPLIAVLATDKRAPGYVASVDLAKRQLTLVRLGDAPASGKSHELWALGGGRKKAQSLGLADRKTVIPLDRLGTGEAALRDTTLAVSLEPAGGSPTGQATGPVVFVGKLVPAPKS